MISGQPSEPTNPLTMLSKAKKSLLANGAMSSRSTTCVKTSEATYSSAVQPKMRLPGQHDDVARRQPRGQRIPHRREGHPLALERPDHVIDADDAIEVGQALRASRRTAPASRRVARTPAARRVSAASTFRLRRRGRDDRDLLVGCRESPPRARPPLSIAGRWRRRPWPTADR